MPEVTAGFGLCAEPALMIMVSLTEGALDGHGITRRIDLLGGVPPTRETLYGTLARLEARGLIECRASASPSSSHHRPYALSEAGLLHLQRWLGSLHAFVLGGLDRLAVLRGPATIDLREPGPVDQPV